ncbi:hypothetical protein, partial [Treponema sp.]|uniref:hypothetical protein n=1 Tax=Treponema sp. TaxID=166 RepID=UPI0025FFD80C
MKSIRMKLISSNVALVLFSIILITIPIIAIQYRTLMAQTKEDADDKIMQGYHQINHFMQEPISIVHTVSHYLNTH